MNNDNPDPSDPNIKGKRPARNELPPVFRAEDATLRMLSDLGRSLIHTAEMLRKARDHPNVFSAIAAETPAKKKSRHRRGNKVSLLAGSLVRYIM